MLVLWNLIFVLVLIKKVILATEDSGDGNVQSRGEGHQTAKITAIRIYSETNTSEADSKPTRQQTRQSLTQSYPQLPELAQPLPTTSGSFIGTFVNVLTSALQRITLFFSNMFSVF
uniref:Uncharacterized protein n=1 Tax=Graphocephala atropunctata TaxID=36148 RepID=A0A1B6MDZ8_9HEMI